MPNTISKGVGDHPSFLTFIAMIPVILKLWIFAQLVENKDWMKTAGFHSAGHIWNSIKWNYNPQSRYFV